MKTIRSIYALAAILAFSVFVSCDSDDDAVAQNSIADIASGNQDLSMLTQALDRAGLVSTLDASGSFTVFAPTNAAFNTFLENNGFDSIDDVPEIGRASCRE